MEEVDGGGAGLGELDVGPGVGPWLPVHPYRDLNFRTVLGLMENRSRSVYSVHVHLYSRLHDVQPRSMADLFPELLTEHLAPAL